MKMVWHAYSFMCRNASSFALFKSRYAFPALQHGPSYVVLQYAGLACVIIQRAEHPRIMSPVPNHQRDEVDSGSIIIMPRVMRTI